MGPSQEAKGSPWRHASSSSSCLTRRRTSVTFKQSREETESQRRPTDFFLLRRSLSAGPRVPDLFAPIWSPDACSSDGVDAEGEDQSEKSCRVDPVPVSWSPGPPVLPCPTVLVLPREAEPSRPGGPRRPFSFFRKRRPMEDLMLFFLLDLCRESWLLLEPLPSTDRLERRGTRLGVRTRGDHAAYTSVCVNSGAVQ